MLHIMEQIDGDLMTHTRHADPGVKCLLGGDTDNLQSSGSNLGNDSIHPDSIAVLERV